MTRGISVPKAANLFDEWLKMAVGLFIAMLILMIVVADAGAVIPAMVAGGVIFMMFHAARGFAEADHNRSRRRHK